MNIIKSIVTFVFFALILVNGYRYVSAEIFNRVVAIVNNDVITLYELNQRIKQMTGSAAEDLRDRDEKGYLEARRRILELMIDEKCAKEKIRELGIRVSPKEIDGAIEKIKANNQWTHEDLVAMLKREGITYEEYRDRIKADLQRYKLINVQVKSKIIIREEQIIQYYEEHKEDYSTEERVHLAGIFLIRKNSNDAEEIHGLKLKAEDLLARLRNGEDFGELAKRFSEGPGADDGGDLGIFKKSQLEPELSEALEGIEEGEFTDLIIRASGIQIIKLIKRQGAQVKPFEEVREAIYGILYREVVNKRYTSWIRELRKEAYTKIIF